METPTQTPVQQWPDGIAAQIRWLEQAKLPQRFELHPGAVVENGRQYKDHVLRMLEAGPGYEYAGAAAHILEQLYKRFGNTAVAQ